MEHESVTFRKFIKTKDLAQSPKLSMQEIKLTKEKVKESKLEKNYAFFNTIFKSRSVKNINFVLKHFGRIDDDFDYQIFLPLLNSSVESIRLGAVKCLGRIASNDTAVLQSHFHKENSNSIKREIISSIGRQRDKENIPFFLSALNDKSSEVVLQSMRALELFKTKKPVKNELTRILKHSKNEIVREYANHLLFSSKEKMKLTKEQRKRLVAGFNTIRDKIVCGDALDILKLLPENSIHLTFTSPPYYNAKEYSLYESYEEYLELLTRIFKEVHRVTIEGRFFVINTSPVIIPRISRKFSSTRYFIPFDLHPKITNLGFEFIDDLLWAKPEASVFQRNGGFFQHRKPLAYKPNPRVEYVLVYRKKTNHLIDWNLDLYDREQVNESKITENYETSNIWEIPPTSTKNHPAVFPLLLAENIVKYYSLIGDIVYDPFAGSGTVGEAAIRNKRSFFLNERNQNYCNYSFQQLTKQTNKVALLNINNLKKLI